MARSKSTPGSKADSKSQALPKTPAAVPDGKTVAEAVSGKVNAEPRNYERRKPQPPSSVLPMNVEEEIRRRAYELYAQRGYSSGSEKDDWLVAEQEVMQRYHHQHSS